MTDVLSPRTVTTVLAELEPKEVLGLFEILANIPRGSGNEIGVAKWVVQFATDLGLEAIRDDLNCVLVRKPGQGGLENSEPLILHGHLDMVCEKAEGVEFDFIKDPIQLMIDGDFITARGTSLGADNGIGVSYILALLASTDLPHPPLEAVLTSMEELGKGGASQFDVSLLRGRRMIDFNWISDTEILAGCSGDVTFTVDVDADFEQVPAANSAARLLTVRGLKGGHCEFDIQLERANALQVMARAVNTILEVASVRLASPFGGAQNNAIPADAEVVLAVQPEDLEAIETVVASLNEDLRKEYGVADPDIRLELAAASVPTAVFSPHAARRLLGIIILIPHGVISWNLSVPGRVETSNNLGTIRPTDAGVQLMSTITSAVTSRKHEVFNRVRALAEVAGSGVTVATYGLDAPEFPYRPDSELLAIASDAYRFVMGTDAAVEVSQCSLELGMFSRRVPVADIISIGTELHA
ncbi:MAG: beta-Ala-His dipeptidase, partial [Candidatus Saccharibacteria bacterium]|nr:beta-Ala-His dipeptidase [Microbacteriaceae bacterium]